MIRLMIQEMEDTLVEVRSQAVRTIADKKEIERKLEGALAKQNHWDEKAEVCASQEPRGSSQERPGRQTQARGPGERFARRAGAGR